MPVPWSEAWPSDMNTPLPMVLTVSKVCHQLLRTLGVCTGPRAAPSDDGVGGVRGVGGVTRRQLNNKLLSSVANAQARKHFQGTTPWFSFWKCTCKNSTFGFQAKETPNEQGMCDSLCPQGTIDTQTPSAHNMCTSKVLA